MRRKISAIYALLLLLAACVASRPGLPVLEKATPAMSPEKDGRPSSAPAGLGLVTQDEAGYGLRGRPVDPRTLADLPGYERVDFGHHYTSAFSPDGSTMALVTWPEGRSQGGTLHLVEKPAWNVLTTGVAFNQHVSSLHFSPEGDALYWVEAAQRDAAHGIPRDYRLYRYNVEGAQGTIVTELPSSIQPWEMRLLPGGTATGERLAIYGLPIGAENLVGGVPHVLFVDLAAGALAGDVPLQGVTAGQFRVKTAEEGENPYRMVRPGLAWDLERSLLYVVHGDEDRVTMVDLEEAEVRRQVDIQPRQSFLERILGWGAGVAEAKVMPPGANKQAVLTPDGSHLYVTGLHREMLPAAEEDGWNWQETPLGLQVISTGDLTEAQQLDLPVNELALSPDGRWLLLKGGYDATGPDGDIERVKRGLYVVDASRVEVTAHLLPEQEVYLQGFSADGRRAYVSTGYSEWLGDRYGNWTVTLHLLDLQTGRLVAEREFPGYVLDVIE